MLDPAIRNAVSIDGTGAGRISGDMGAQGGGVLRSGRDTYTVALN